MSAVIILLISGMWGAVLVPMWLRRHDAVYETRSVDRFSTAMRVLSRRSTPSVERRVFVSPGGPAPAPVVVVSGGARPVRGPRTSSRVFRLRRLVAVLSLTAVVTLLMSGSVVWLAGHLACDLLLGGALVSLRGVTVRDRQARAAARRRMSRAMSSYAVSAQSGAVLAEPVLAHDATVVRVAMAGRTPMIKLDRVEPIAPPVAEPVIVAEEAAEVAAAAAALAAQRVAPSPRRAAAAARRVVPAPRRNAPPAQPAAGAVAAGSGLVAAPRVLDLTVPGRWSTGPLLDDETAVELADEVEIDLLLERRRVV